MLSKGKSFAFVVLCCVSLNFACVRADASQFDVNSGTAPLLQSIAHSHLIVVARLMQIANDPTRHPITSSDTHTFALNPPGTYKFEVVEVLRGKPASTLNIYLPQTNISAYGNAKVPVENGKLYLLLLEPQREKQNTYWTAVDPLRALLPLTANTKVQTKEKNPNVVTRIIDLLIMSFSDPLLRRANSYVLRGMVHPYMSQVLKPYIDDPSRDVQANVLNCMAANQQVEAIPKIAELERRAFSEHDGVDVVLALNYYKTAEAIPYLNPLLFHVAEYVRVNTATALRDLANSTSIPYLVLALHDPNAFVNYDAYATLCRLIPILGPLKTISEFEGHREEILKPVYAWWRDELDGKHLPAVK